MFKELLILNRHLKFPLLEKKCRNKYIFHFYLTGVHYTVLQVSAIYLFSYVRSRKHLHTISSNVM